MHERAQHSTHLLVSRSTFLLLFSLSLSLSLCLASYLLVEVAPLKNVVRGCVSR